MTGHSSVFCRHPSILRSCSIWPAICWTPVDSDATSRAPPSPASLPRRGTYLGRHLLWPASKFCMTGCELKAQASPLSSRLAGPHSQASPASPYLPPPDRRRRPLCVKCKKPAHGFGCCRVHCTFSPDRGKCPGSSPGLVCDHLNEMRLWRTSHSFPGWQTEADAGVGQHLHQLLLQVHLTFSMLMSEINE